MQLVEVDHDHRITGSPDHRITGYTLGVANSVSAAFPLMFDGFAFAPGKDFVAITPLGRAPSFLAVRNDLPVKNAAEFLAYAKANSGKITFAAGIHGSPPHVARCC